MAKPESIAESLLAPAMPIAAEHYVDPTDFGIGPNVQAIFNTYGAVTQTFAETLYATRGQQYAVSDLHFVSEGTSNHTKTNSVKRARDRIEEDFPGRIRTEYCWRDLRIWWTQDTTPEEDEELARQALIRRATLVIDPTDFISYEEFIGESVPTGLPIEVWARYRPVAQLMLKHLISRSGQPVPPHTLKEHFNKPEGSSTSVQISAHLRQAKSYPDVGRWLHPGGHGASKFWLWGEQEQAEAIEAAQKRGAAPRRKRVITPVDRGPTPPKLEAKSPEATPLDSDDAAPASPPDAKSNVQPVASIYIRRLTPLVRDAQRGAAVLKAWELHIDHEQAALTLAAREVALPYIDEIAVEIVHAAAEIKDWLTPTDACTLISEVSHERVRVGAVLKRLDMLRAQFIDLKIPGWQDTGRVRDSATAQRRFRLLSPEELRQA